MGERVELNVFDAEHDGKRSELITSCTNDDNERVGKNKPDIHVACSILQQDSTTLSHCLPTCTGEENSKTIMTGSMISDGSECHLCIQFCKESTEEQCSELRNKEAKGSELGNRKVQNSGLGGKVEQCSDLREKEAKGLDLGGKKAKGLDLGGKEASGSEYGDRVQSSSRTVYHCGICLQTFCTICHLHNHFTMLHKTSGSYHYDYYIRTAFPKYESFCQFTQTENTDFNREGIFDILERKRTCDKNSRHEINDGASKSKVRKKSKTVKGSGISGVINDVYESSVTDEANWREIKVEPVDLVENNEPVKFVERDGYISDGTDDYFDDEEEDVTEIVLIHKATSKEDDSGTTGDVSSQQCKSRKTTDSILSGEKHRENKAEEIISTNKVDSKIKSSSKNNIKQKHDRKNKKKAVSLNEMNDSGNKCNKIENKLVLSLKSENIKESRKVQIGGKYSKEISKNPDCKCSICGAVFTVKQGLLRHEQLKHADHMKFKCDYCDKKFMRHFNLQKHTVRVHKINKHKWMTEQTDREDTQTSPDKLHFGSSSLGVTPDKLLSDSSSPGVTPDNVHSGTSSDKMYSGASKFVIEVEGESVRKELRGCVMVKLSRTRRKRRTNEEVKSLKTPHTCDLCGHTMPKSKIDVHKRLHSGERPYICGVCGKGLISQNKLSRHMLLHGEVKKHTCEICGVGFHMKYKLRMHMHIHTGKKPYLCSICGAEFNHSANLATHTRCVHLQVKPYVCNVCGGRYSKRSQLDDHVFSHSTERQFTCRYCGKSFKYFKGMRRHEKSHAEEESFSCNQCGLKFSRKDNLDRHKASHGETNFQCNICKKVLKDSRALQEHDFTHVVAKGYKCSICEEMFYSSSKYFTHLSVMHNIQKQEAQLMIMDEQMQKNNKQADVHPNVTLPANSDISQSVTSFETVEVSAILENASKENMNMNLLTRVATENLSLHSQDIRADEKVNILIPPLNPMILYEKNRRITTIDNGNSTGTVFSLDHKGVGNSTADSISYPDHVYSQVKHDVETHNSHHSNITMPHPDGSMTHVLNETVLGFVTSNALTSINNLTSYIGQRPQSLTPMSNLTTGLQQDEHGAIESLRQLQDNPVVPITLVSTTEGMVVSPRQHNVLMSSTGTSDDSTQSDYRIQNLY